MLVNIFWIDKIHSGRLGIMPRPRGGDWLEDEIKSLKNSGVGVLVSLLETEEVTELDISGEEKFCRLNDILFLLFPIKDRDVPLSIQKTSDFVRELTALLKNGKDVVIHCRQGIGRSSLMAACILVGEGFSSPAAFEKIKNARGCEVPDTIEQIDWVTAFARSL